MLAAGLMLVGGALGSAQAASGAHRPTGVVHSQVRANPASVAGTLHDQNSDDNGIGISSQNFESAFDAYDDQGADDFKIGLGHIWKIKVVNVTGVYYNGSGPAVSENVTIYKNSGGFPGAVMASQTITGLDTGGSFSITLAPAVTLNSGKYWISVQANMDFNVGGQWGWETRNTQYRLGAEWQNPGDGFSTGCTTYTNLLTCIPSGEGPDFMYSLVGKKIA